MSSIGLVESHALTGDLIYLRGFIECTSSITYIFPPKVIDQKKYNIVFFILPDVLSFFRGTTYGSECNG
jgi:hypothetical protein